MLALSVKNSNVFCMAWFQQYGLTHVTAHLTNALLVAKVNMASGCFTAHHLTRKAVSNG